MKPEVIQVWDEWFAATQDEESMRTWRAAKETIESANLERWAHIIEMNRIDRVCERRKIEQAQSRATAEGE